MPTCDNRQKKQTGQPENQGNQLQVTGLTEAPLKPHKKNTWINVITGSAMIMMTVPSSLFISLPLSS